MRHVLGFLGDLEEIVRGWHILAVENLSRQNLGPGSIVAGSILLIVITAHGVTRLIWCDELMGREIGSVCINGMSLYVTILVLLTIVFMWHVLRSLRTVR